MASKLVNGKRVLVGSEADPDSANYSAPATPASGGGDLNTKIAEINAGASALGAQTGTQLAQLPAVAKPSVLQTTTGTRAQTQTRVTDMNSKIAAGQGATGTPAPTDNAAGGTNSRATQTPAAKTQPAQTADDPFGTGEQEDALTAASSARVKTIYNQLEQTKTLTNTATRNLISSLQQTFGSRIDEMRQFNRALLGGKTVAGFRSGRAQYAPEMQGDILTVEEQEGTMRIAKLEGEMLFMIAQAQQAQADNNWKTFNEAYDQVEQTQANLQNEIANLHKTVMDAQTMRLQQSQEERAQSQETREQEKFTLAKATTVSESAAPALAVAVEGMDEMERVEFIQQAAEDMGVDPAILGGAVEKQLRQGRLDKLDEMNVLSSIRERQISNQISAGHLSLSRRSQQFEEEKFYAEQEIEAAEKAAEAERKASDTLPVIQDKLTLIDSLLSSKGMPSSVGPNRLARVPTGGIFGVASNLFTGDKSNFIAGVNQLVNKETMDTLLNLKAGGGTLGALSDQERIMLQQSASKIGSWAMRNSDGEVTGFNTSEASFIKELQNIRTIAIRAQNKALSGAITKQDASNMDALLGL